MRKTNKLFLVSGVLLVSGQMLLATPLETRWYTKTLNVTQGDDFKVNLYVYPDTGRPIKTVSNTLVYNPKYVDFVESSFPTGWSVLTNEPYFLTDESLGMIRRTAGFASGVQTPSAYVTYEFQAKKIGKTTISIEDGFALDAQNVDVGLQTKAMTINVLPRKTASGSNSSTNTATTTSKTATTSNATSNDLVDNDVLTADAQKMLASIQTLNVTMDAVGRTALYEGDDYVATVNLKQLPVSNDAGEIQVTLYNDQDDLVYSVIEVFKPGETSKDITIPANAFKEGDYQLNIKTIYKNLNTDIETTKQIGVLKRENVSIVDMLINNWRYFSGGFALLVLIVLFHIRRDHADIKAIKTKYRKVFKKK